MPAPRDSIWGSINTCFEIGIEIYQLFCKAQNGETKNGLALPVDRAKEMLSKKALSTGIEKDGFIYVAEWNADHAKLGEQISPNGSIPMMFLQEHYDFEAEEPREATADYFRAEKTGELETDTGFEQLGEDWELER